MHVSSSHFESEPQSNSFDCTTRIWILISDYVYGSFQLVEAVKDATSDYEKEKLQERLGKLSGGIAVLKVCAMFVCCN